MKPDTLDGLVSALLLAAALGVGIAIGYHAATVEAANTERAACANQVPGR